MGRVVKKQTEGTFYTMNSEKESKQSDSKLLTVTNVDNNMILIEV